MQKEIREQPDTVRDACRGRLRRGEGTAAFGGLNMTARSFAGSAGWCRRVRKSWHAALVGEYLIERLANLPVEVEYAGEFRYRNAPLDDRTLVFVLSQSGETADTLGALRESKRRGHPTLAICNVVARRSPARRWRDLPPRRPEVGVASTKAFSAQVTVLTLAGPAPGQTPPALVPDGLAWSTRSRPCPMHFEGSGDRAADHQGRERLASARSVMYLGRDLHFPVALEGA